MHILFMFLVFLKQEIWKSVPVGFAVPVCVTTCNKLRNWQLMDVHETLYSVGLLDVPILFKIKQQ